MLLFLMGTATSGCSGGGSVGADSNRNADSNGQTYVANELTVDGVLTPAAEDSFIELTFTENGIPIIAGCNTIFGMATLVDGVLTVPADFVGSTKRACSEMLMAQDQALITFSHQIRITPLMGQL